jgi:hypothetical protein
MRVFVRFWPEKACFEKSHGIMVVEIEKEF